MPDIAYYAQNYARPIGAALIMVKVNNSSVLVVSILVRNKFLPEGGYDNSFGIYGMQPV